MEFQDLLQKDIEELKNDLAKYQADLRDLRFQAFNGRLKKVTKISETKRAIAQIKTALKQLQKQS